MSLKRISVNIVDSLSKLEKQGGQGVIYKLPPNKLIKIYPTTNLEESAEISHRLEALGQDEGMYRGLAYFCAIPEALVVSPDNKVVGFQMSHFKDFHSLGMLADVKYCLEKKIRIKDVINIFKTAHDKVCRIHKKFLIGDFNPRNILFRMDEKKVLLAFVDVDSWAVRLSTLTLPDTAATRVFCHPELENASTQLQAYHDWYSFAILLARSILKADPFSLGSFKPEASKINGGNSKKFGITCWDQRIHLTKEERIYVHRFGNILPTTLQKWIDGTQRTEFPKEVLDEFLEGLVFCENCHLEVHIDHVNCVKCGSKLPKPRLRTAKKTAAMPNKIGVIPVQLHSQTLSSTSRAAKGLPEKSNDFLSNFLKTTS